VTGDAATGLIADDDLDILALVRVRLERAGFRVVCARDGEEALALAEEHAPDLAIVDVMMPRLDGHGLTRALRARDETADIPILVLTAAVHNATVEGADEHMRKPFSPRELVARVEALLAAGS